MSKSTTEHQKAISLTRLREIIDLCKEKGVRSIKITGKDVELEMFPFSVNIGSVASDSLSDVDLGSGLGHNDDSTDLDLLLHSAGR